MIKIVLFKMFGGYKECLCIWSMENEGKKEGGKIWAGGEYIIESSWDYYMFGLDFKWNGKFLKKILVESNMIRFVILKV